MSYSKPIRKPRFRDWLLYILDNNLCDQDTRWKDRSSRTAIIRWPHKSRGIWSLGKDTKLFEMWAVESGKYQRQRGLDKPNPKSWKCNFRMNLNICKNIVELKQHRISKGPNACRVFRFLGPPANFQVAPEMDEIPVQVDDGIWSLSNQALSAETGHTSFQQVEQNQPFNHQHQPIGSRSSLTALGTIEQDPIKIQIDAFEAAELNKLADSFGEPPEYCESHM